VRSPERERPILAVIGKIQPAVFAELERDPAIEERVRSEIPDLVLVNRAFRERPTVARVGRVRVGGDDVVVIAGPCSVEGREAVLEVAHAVRDAGAHILRGGAYKPRTSPYAFQGLGQEGLRLLAEAKERTGLPIVTELMDARDLPAVLEVADVIQIGARNMQNYSLLSEVGRSGCPVLIKRGLSSTLEELLMAAEYVLKEGNENVLLCERGIRTFETAYRFTLDLTAVPVLKELTHLPVIVDPSHAAGRRALVEPLSLAAAAVGADGIIVEVHPEPDEAICDGPQQLRNDVFADYAARVEQAAAVAGKVLQHATV
jgi:3-deoxy-7-phosphoheptulonate synthase